MITTDMYVCICTYYNRHTHIYEFQSFVPTNSPPSSYIILVKIYVCMFMYMYHLDGNIYGCIYIMYCV